MAVTFKIYSISNWREKGIEELRATRDKQYIHNPDDLTVCYILPGQGRYRYGCHAGTKGKQWFDTYEEAAIAAEKLRLATFKRLWAKIDELVKLEF